ncbi:MAG: hypothetical protein Q4D38_02170 [Planctomycetia bacterium]|nr:hypothetical protein [Planctomycetia bacterium]
MSNKKGIANQLAWRFGLVAFIGVVALVCGATGVCAQKKSSWLTNKDLEKKLAEPMPSVTWSDAPMKKSLRNFCDMQRICLVLDRRVDPELLVRGDFENAALPQMIRDALATGALIQEELELSRLGNVLYVGPARYVQRLQTLVELQKEAYEALPERGKKVWEKESSLSWQTLDTPRDVLEKIAKRNKIKIQGAKIPHDLWEGATLPPMSLSEQFILILGQFGLTYEFDLAADKNGGVVTIRPIDYDSLLVTRSYQMNKLRENKLNVLRREMSDVRIEASGSRVEISGIAEAHAFFASSLPSSVGVSIGNFPQAASINTKSGAKLSPKDRAKIRLSGNIRGPFIPIMKDLAQKQGLTLEYDADTLINAGVQLEAQIQVTLQESTVEQAFQSVAEAAGCSATLEGEVIYIEMKK